jgi:hypothetical protein
VTDSIGDDLNWPQSFDGFDFSEFRQRAAGPLMISTLSMFGNSSFFHTAGATTGDVAPTGLNSTASFNALSAICQSVSLPFTALIDGSQFTNAGDVCSELIGGRVAPDDNFNPDLLNSLVYTWVSNLNDSSISQEVLGAATFFANEAVLSTTADVNFAFGSRSIYTSEGMRVTRPYRSVAGLIVVGVFVLMQLVGIAVLLVYIHSTPTWTETLDAFALARIGAQLERDRDVILPSIGVAGSNDLDPLDDVDGVVGVCDRYKDAEAVSASGVVQLAVGGKGLVTRDLAKKRSVTEVD